jgi:hypothetical protein
MPGEEGGDEGRAPEGLGGAMEDEEKEHGAEGVEKDVAGMVATRGKAKQLAVQRMRKPGQRMPVAGVTDIEGPGQSGRGEAVVDVEIVEEVGRVVVVDKIEMEHRQVEEDRA